MTKIKHPQPNTFEQAVDIKSRGAYYAIKAGPRTRRYVYLSLRSDILIDGLGPRGLVFETPEAASKWAEEAVARGEKSLRNYRVVEVSR